MTDHEYFNRIRKLSIELERSGNAKPYDPDAYNDVIDRLNLLFTSKGKHRRRRPWFICFCIFCWLLALAIVVYGILRPL